MIQRLHLPRSEANRAYLKMGELLFNMHETFPETYFSISTVQNEGNIEAHHIFKNENDPTEEEREIGRRPKLLCRIISFCFPEKVRCWFLSNELCAFKSLRSVSRGVWEEPQNDPTVDSRDMATGVLLFLPNSAPLSLAEFSIVSPSFFFSFFFFFPWTGGLWLF